MSATGRQRATTTISSSSTARNELLCCYCCLPACLLLHTVERTRFISFFFFFSTLCVSPCTTTISNAKLNWYDILYTISSYFYASFPHCVSRIGDSNHIHWSNSLTFFSFRFHSNRPPKFHISLMSSLHNHTHFSSYQNNQKQTIFFLRQLFADASSFFHRFFLSSIIHTISFFDIYLYIFFG